MDSQFIKDETSGALINTNMDGFIKFKSAREQAKKTKDILTKLSSIEIELRDIKTLLIKVIGDKIT